MISQYAKGFLFWFLISFLLLYLIKRRRGLEKKDVYKLLLIAYLVAICSQTLFPGIDCGVDSLTGKPYIHILFRSREMGGVNLIPLKTILSEVSGTIPNLAKEDQISVAILNLAGNVCLYVPIGFLLPLVKRKGRNRYSLTVLWTLAFSCGIEILQYFVGRSADIDDVLLHLLGASIGFSLWKGLAYIQKQKTNRSIH